MYQFMDKSFIVTVRLSKETGYNYNNITIRIVYNDKQSICYIYIYSVAPIYRGIAGP